MLATSTDAEELSPAPRGTSPLSVRLKAGISTPVSRSDRDDAQRIVAPMVRSLFRQAVERVNHLLVKIRGIDGDVIVVARADGRQSCEIDGRRHDEAIGIIGMLADHVNAPRCDKDGGLLSESLQVDETW